MRTITLLFLLFISIAFSSTTALAGGGQGGGNSSPDGICVPLKDPGVTKGLFGLCVAYCEAGAHSEKVLDNYNRKRTEDDPTMPCLEETDPTLNCLCWNNSTAGEVGLGEAAASSCSLEDYGDSLYYYESETGDSETLIVGSGYCGRYSYSAADGTFGTIEEDLTTVQEQADCDIEVRAIAYADFQGFSCLD